jgi:NTE family protein
MFNIDNIRDKKILVFSGGGIKGIAFIGVLKALEQLELLDNFQILSGCSIGSIIIALFLIGYTPDELRDFIIEFDMSKTKNISLLNILDTYGLDSGDKFFYVIERLIQTKNIDPNITIGELYIKINKKYKFYFSTVCVNDLKPVYLNPESYPDVSLITALRMSSAVPLYFNPINYQDNLYVDGGVIDNYPISLFKDQLDDVIGVFLNYNVDIIEHKNINNLESYLEAVFMSIMVGSNINSKKGYEKYTIDININHVNFLDFNIDRDKKLELYHTGYDTIMDIMLK